MRIVARIVTTLALFLFIWEDYLFSDQQDLTVWVLGTAIVLAAVNYGSQARRLYRLEHGR